jgi:hypothetical protein
MCTRNIGNKDVARWNLSKFSTKNVIIRKFFKIIRFGKIRKNLKNSDKFGKSESSRKKLPNSEISEKFGWSGNPGISLTYTTGVSMLAKSALLKNYKKTPSNYIQLEK